MASTHHKTPEALDAALVAHAESRDVDALHELWEPEPAFIPAPGKVAHGSHALRARLLGWTGMQPTKVVFRIAERLVSGDLATDVVRRSDAGWRFVLDNPFGTVAFERQ